MDLQTIVNHVCEHFNHATGALTTPAQTRILAHVNQWHRRILTRPGLERYRYTTVSVDSVASTPTIRLPSLAERVLRVRDETNQRDLTEKSYDWYRATYPDPDAATGTPVIYVPMGTAHLIRQAAASGLWAVSSSASDTTPTVAVIGSSATAAKKAAAITLNGTTRVAVGSDTDWLEVGVSLSAAAVGTVSLYDAAADGNVVLTIPVGELRYQALVVALVDCPSAVVTYTIDVERRLRDFTLASDQPWIPEDWHWLLEQGGKVNEYERLDDPRLRGARVDLEAGINAFRLRTSPQVIVPGGSRAVGVSTLGAWYPADTVVSR